MNRDNSDHPRQPAIGAAVMLAISFCGVISLMIVAGCIGNKPFNPAATQPTTVINPITTQPSYYLNQPAAAQLEDPNFQRLWTACEEVARNYLFVLDREDYRAGLITTVPMVSKQWLEFWRKDAGTSHDVDRSTLATTRRTLRFEFEHEENGEYRVTPKVLVEQQTVLERRITSVTQYRGVFAGPGEKTAGLTDAGLEIPATYWLPISRDTAMEIQVSKAVEKRLQRH